MFSCCHFGSSIDAAGAFGKNQVCSCLIRAPDIGFMDLPQRRGAPWTIGEEHRLDRLYREEQETIHQIAIQVARTTSAVMGRLSLMYFGMVAWDNVDRSPWNYEDDVQLREWYHGSNGDNDRAAIVKRLGRQPHCIAGRLLEVIPRSQISLSKAGWIGRALSYQTSLSFHSPSRCSSDAALMNLSCAPTPFLKRRRLCKRCPFQYTWDRKGQSTCGKCKANKVHVVALSLDFVWEDELHGLSQLASARRSLSRLLLPHVAARLILSFLVLPSILPSPRVY